MHPLTMNDFAHHIIAIANQNDQPITEIQLQAVMYFTFKYMVKNQMTPNALKIAYQDNPFLVKRYGPNIQAIFDEYQIYGAMQIIEDYQIIPEIDAQVNTEIKQLLKLKPMVLILKTRSEPFWQKHINQNYGKTYSLTKIAV